MHGQCVEKDIREINKETVRDSGYKTRQCNGSIAALNNPKSTRRHTHTHIHTHTCIYIYIYI